MRGYLGGRIGMLGGPDRTPSGRWPNLRRVKPADISLFRIPGRPVVTGDGSIVLAVSSPDLTANIYRSTLVRLDSDSDDGLAGFSQGPRDSEPVVSPDGRQLIFLRAPESGPAQLYVMPLGGGEPRKLTEHPLGAGSVVFRPDGRRVAYCAAVPEPGRYGTDEHIKPDAEAPRRITRLSYRLDGEGFVTDKAKQLFVLDLIPGATPVQLTAEPAGAADPVFVPDGRIAYVRSTGIDELTEEIAVIDAPADRPGSAAVSPAVGELLVSTRGSAALPVVIGGEVVYLGVEFVGVDAVGRTTGLWAAPLSGGVPRRLTDEQTVDVDRAAGRPVVIGDRVLVGVLDRGATSLCAVPLAADRVPLPELPVMFGGARVVRSFDARDRTVVAVVADGVSAGEVITVTFSDDGSAVDERVLTEFGGALTATGIRPALPLHTTAPDGYPVHGWLVLPAGEGPHPTLLVVHGGPHAAFTPALFDEAQVYAGAGYAVVMGNPRGSAGYGQAHGRAVIGALGTVDVDDVLALLDAATARPECAASRVGVMGGSYGGFMTSWLCSHAKGRFTAAISERAVNAWDSFAGSSDIGYYFARAYVGDDRDSQWRTSPLAYADEVDVPLLIIHSEHDWRCPIEQGQRLFVALEQRGAPVEMLLFPGEGHELSRSGVPMHRKQRFDAILDWWSRYLPVPGG